MPCQRFSCALMLLSTGDAKFDLKYDHAAGGAKTAYCIDAYTKDGLERGITKEEMMEAVHVGAAIKSGASLVHGVMMMNKVNKLDS